jgi:CMP/dCMP kinase
MPPLTIAIDGPAGSGKSSVARSIAGILGYLYLDSGAMYRAFALKALRLNVPPDNEARLEKLAQQTRIELKQPTPQQEKAGIKNRVFLDGTEVTDDIRTPEVAQAASRLAVIAGVRAVLVAEQQRAGAGGGVIMEGRDIGTVVFPKAELKIFLDASPEVRAERRWKEHQEKGAPMTLEQVLEEVRQRDKRDRERKVSPLVPASDAVLVDNTAMDVAETASLIVLLVREREKELAAAAGRRV